MPVNSVRRNGSYAPLSAHYYKDDAIDEAGLDSELLYVRGLAFCADVLSDGFISDRQLVRFVGVGMDDAAERAKRLVAVDLWERVEGGYQVRSWLDWNRSRSEITERQVKDRERKAKDRGPESETPPPEPPDDVPPDSDRNPNGIHADSGGLSDGSPNGVQPRAPVRARAPRHSTPRNSTTRHEDSSSADADAAPAEPAREDVEQICTRLRDRIVGNGLKEPTITADWRRQARLLLDADKRDLAQALRLIDWCQADPFWQGNVLSLPKFRKQYDQLLVRARQDQARKQERHLALAAGHEDRVPTTTARFRAAQALKRPEPGGPS